MRAFAIGVGLFAVAVSSSAGGWCGIDFRVPRGWQVHVSHPEANICAVGVSPRNWRTLAEKSRWPESDDAIEFHVIRGDLDAAAEDAGWFRGEHGELRANDRGRDFEVDDVEYGGMSGYESRGWYRGYANDGADLQGTSRIYSGFYDAIVLERAKSSFIVMTYHEWSPDIPTDRVSAAKLILRTIRRR